MEFFTFFKELGSNFLALFKDDVNKENYSKRITELLIFSVFFLIALTILFIISIKIWEIGLSSKTILSLVLFIIFIAYLLYAANKFSQLKLHTFCEECIEIKNANRFDGLLIKKYDTTKKYLRGLFREAPDHNTFINKMQKHAQLKIEYLELIEQDARNSVCSRFFCVISNQKYYSGTEDNINDLLIYFAKHYQLAQDNYFSRFFCVPYYSSGAKRRKKISEYKQNTINKNILKYLILNRASGVVTYLMAIDKAYLNYDFFKEIDYVLASPLTYKINGKLKSINRLYFSYATDIDIDQIIYTDDLYLVKIFEEEFLKRRNYLENTLQNIQVEMMTPPVGKDRQYFSILKTLRFDVNKDKDEVNDCINELIAFIDSEKEEILHASTLIEKIKLFKI